MKILYIFRGLPGSGKSTLAREFAPLVVEPDMFRYNAEMDYIFDSDKNGEVLEKTEDLVLYAMRHLKLPAIAIAATHTKIAHMEHWFSWARKLGYGVTVVECYGDYGNIHNVPQSVITRMSKDFEPLSDEEAHERKIILIRKYKGEE